MNPLWRLSLLFCPCFLKQNQQNKILENVYKEGSAILTDTATEFKPLDGQDSKYFHFTVNHSKGEYCSCWKNAMKNLGASSWVSSFCKVGIKYNRVMEDHIQDTPEQLWKLIQQFDQLLII
jgi:hypothetical protein